MALLKSFLLLLLVVGFANLGLSQTTRERSAPDQKPASGTPKPDGVTRNDDEEPPLPKENDPFEMLQQAYYAGGQLPTDEHAYQLGEVVIVAAKMKHPMLRQWVHETLQLTQNLPQQQSLRQPTEQGAVVALSDTDVAEALELLGELMPVSVTAPAIAIVPDDPRTRVARQIFPKYWKAMNGAETDRLRSVANYLGETGQYPSAALGLILKDLHAKDAAVAESLFLDALQYFGREQTNSAGVYIEFTDLLKAAKGVVPEAMERAAIELAVDKLLKQVAAPMPSDSLFMGRVYTAKGFVQLNSMAEESLFKLLPLIREFEPDLEQRIDKQITAFSKPVPSDIGPLPEGYEEASFMIGRASDPAEKEKMSARMVDGNRAGGARQLAATSPEAALKLANSITDPALRATALVTVAQGKLKETDPEMAAKLLADAAASAPKPQPNAGETSKEGSVQLASLVSLARAQSSDATEQWSSLNRGLDLAEEMFTEGLKTSRRLGYRNSPDWTGPVYFAPGFVEANSLIKIGMEKETANTLGWLAKEHDPALKSYLLISAAEGLWNKMSNGQKPAPASPAPGSAPGSPASQEIRTTMMR